MRAFLLVLLTTLGLAAEDARVVQLVDAALAQAQEAADRLPGTWQVKLAHPPTLPPLMPPGPVTVAAARLSKREPSGRFFVVLDLQVEARRVGQVRVDLEGRWSGQLWKTREALPRRTALDPALLEPVPFEGVPPDGALMEPPEGCRTRGPVPAGRVLTRMDVEAVPLVQAGEKVRITAEVGELTIRTEALARTSGALGERIRLEAPGTRKPIQAVVTGPAEARLAL